MKEHPQVLIAPFHDATGNVQGLGARVRCAQEPGEIAVPGDELAVEVAAILGGEEG